MTNEPDAGEVFSAIYESDHWDGGSGVGSAVDATAVYREVLARLLSGRDVRSVVDVGCGDWQLGSLVDWSSVDYLGIDVVADVAAANQRRFGRPGVRFEVIDVRRDALPVADLLLVKDVLQHWPLDDVTAFLDAVLHRYRYVLITNDVASAHWTGPVNTEMQLGGWRTLALEEPPLSRPATWRSTFDVRGEWTKQMLLYTSPKARRARWRPGSALRRLNGFAPQIQGK